MAWSGSTSPMTAVITWRNDQNAPRRKKARPRIGSAVEESSSTADTTYAASKQRTMPTLPSDRRKRPRLSPKSTDPRYRMLIRTPIQTLSTWAASRAYRAVKVQGMKMMTVTTENSTSSTRNAGYRIRSRERKAGRTSRGGSFAGKNQMQSAASAEKPVAIQNRARKEMTWASTPVSKVDAISPREYADSTVVITMAIRSRGTPSVR